LISTHSRLVCLLILLLSNIDVAMVNVLSAFILQVCKYA